MVVDSWIDVLLRLFLMSWIDYVGDFFDFAFDVLDHCVSIVWRLFFDCLATHPNRLLFQFDRPIQGSPQMTVDPAK